MKKYYAVKVGRTPGVYTSWLECKEQVNGFCGAKYKSFLDRKEANEFIGIQEEKLCKDDSNTKSNSDCIFTENNLLATNIVDATGRALKLNDGIRCTVKGVDYYGALRYHAFTNTYYIYFEEHWSGFPFTKTPLFYYCLGKNTPTS